MLLEFSVTQIIMCARLSGVELNEKPDSLVSFEISSVNIDFFFFFHHPNAYVTRHLSYALASEKKKSLEKEN